MTSEELAQEVERVAIEADDQAVDHADRWKAIFDAKDRIRGVGAEQYTDADGQRFERMTMPDLVEYAREEALDLVNYGVMLAIRLDRLRAMLEEAP